MRCTLIVDIQIGSMKEITGALLTMVPFEVQFLSKRDTKKEIMFQDGKGSITTVLVKYTLALAVQNLN
jgi:hypothetical protein